MIRGWLKAGVFEKDTGFAPTDEGTPQGGVFSPLLLNVALHGLEEAAGVRYEASNPARTKRGCPALVVYADDMVALCHTRQQAEQVKARMAEWLAAGLSFNEDKTRIVMLEDGFDFLGFTIRRHAGKLITRASKAAIKRVKHRLAVEMRALRGANAAAVLAKINPIVRGWANYYRGAASSRIFAALDHYLWQLTDKWACFSHHNKPKPGSSPSITASSTPPATTGESSATATAAPGCPGSAGPRSSGTVWSSARRPRTTPP
jgi:RNA-directed DNA polymerase